MKKSAKSKTANKAAKISTSALNGAISTAGRRTNVTSALGAET
jgi:hypothetical protein